MKKSLPIISLLVLPISMGLAVEGEATGTAPVVQPPPNEESQAEPNPNWLNSLICQVLACEEAAEESAPEVTPDEG